MAGTLNKVIIIGYLGQDPEVRYMPNGDAVANVSIATTRKWKDRSTNEDREETEWHRVVFYARVAEVVGEYLHKGSLAYVEGRIRTRKWQDKEGQDRYTTEIVSEQMLMLDRPPGGREPQEGDRRPARTLRREAPAKPAADKGSGGAGKHFDDMADDIPF